MRLIFEFIYNILDVYLHRIRIKNYLKKLDLNCKNIIDIGSHKGESIDFFLQMYHKSKIFGFEPQYDCYNYLKRKFNSKNNIKVVNSALGKIKGSKKLYKNLLSTTSTFSTLNSNSKHYKIKSFLLGNKSAGFYNNEIVKITKEISKLN